MRKYYWVHEEISECYEVIGNGKAKNVKTGEVETTYILRNSGFKLKWVRA